MVHISGDGQVMQTVPWSISRIFSSITNVVFLFVQTMFGLTAPTSGSASSGYSGRRNVGGGSGSGGGGGSVRRIGRIHSLNVDMPTGGCAGGACGR